MKFLQAALAYLFERASALVPKVPIFLDPEASLSVPSRGDLGTQAETRSSAIVLAVSGV